MDVGRNGTNQKLKYLHQVDQFGIQVRIGRELVEDDVAHALDGQPAEEVQALRVEQQPLLAEEEAVANLAITSCYAVLSYFTEFEPSNNEYLFSLVRPCDQDFVLLSLTLFST